ncbi:hypothetical protein R1flu_015989 [Riccia fluitans]|uniref:Uncharacterized protein n=1 Tax=Riccia fluitans TaxID=41844 RepID=A0ABD1YKQ8_9MARC
MPAIVNEDSASTDTISPEQEAAAKGKQKHRRVRKILLELFETREIRSYPSKEVSLYTRKARLDFEAKIFEQECFRRSERWDIRYFPA